MSLIILTGAGSGLGHALARQCLEQGEQLIVLVRRPVPDLALFAQTHALAYHEIVCDLTDAAASARALEQTLAASDCANRAVTLIACAGVIGPIGDLAAGSAGSVIEAVSVNVTAPMLLTQTVLRCLSGRADDIRIALIGSGAGRHSVAGWSVYCATKAALDRFCCVVAEDEKRKPRGARIACIAPGVVDTAMQTAIRQVRSEAFPDQARFMRLKETGALDSAESAAHKLLTLIQSSDFGSTVLDDVRSHIFQEN